MEDSKWVVYIMDDICPDRMRRDYFWWDIYMRSNPSVRISGSSTRKDKYYTTKASALRGALRMANHLCINVAVKEAT